MIALLSLLCTRALAEDPPAEPPKDAPPADAPPTDAPPTDAPPTDAPPTDAPPTDAPPTDTPPADAPAGDAPAEEGKPPKEPKPPKDRAAGETLAPWDDVLAWNPLAPPSERLIVHASLGLGGTSNQYHLSATERIDHNSAADGAALVSGIPVWPTDALGGPQADVALDAAFYLDPTMAVGLSYRPSVPFLGLPAQSHPLAVGFHKTLADKHVVQASIDTNLYDWDRPLRVPDASLHDPLADQFVDGIRRELGVTLGGLTALGPVRLGPTYAIRRGDYGDARLRNWDATGHRLLLGGQWDAGALRAEARGGFASSVARGDSAATDAREADPSWAGTAWALGARLQPDGDLFYAEVGAEMLQRNFRAGDPTDVGHYGRKDVGLRLAVDAGAAPGPLADKGLALSLAYALGYNHTNLHPDLRPDDANDYAEHTVMLVTHFDAPVPSL